MGPSPGGKINSFFFKNQQEIQMVTTGEFEVEFVPYLTGSVSGTVYEPGEPPTRIIDVADNWVVHLDWSLTGPLQRFVCGTWSVDAYMESMGAGDEFELPEPADIPLDPTGSGHYSADFNIPGGFMASKITPGETDIPYKIVATVTYKDLGGRPGPIAGFVEFPLVQFYQDV